jgi:hypothetical protein
MPDKRKPAEENHPKRLSILNQPDVFILYAGARLTAMIESKRAHG